MNKTVLFGLLLGSTIASADVVVFSENFNSYNTSSFSGTDNWFSGYSYDDWSTLSSGTVYATTDDNGGSWGSGGARDNHLVYTGDSWSDFSLDLNIMSDDNETIGVVFRYQDAQNFYLLILVGGSLYPSSGTSEESEAQGSALYVVSNGVSSILDSGQYAFYEGYTHDLRIVADGPTIDVYFDIDLDGAFTGVEHLFSVTDSTLSSGNIGLYCFDNGGGDGGCAFDNVVVSLTDFDSDGIPDVDDNCEEVANVGQSDMDGDGIGDTCDEDVDGDGFTEIDGDCDDLDATINTSADEYCDGIDNNCDGSIDEAGALDADVWYEDADGDGYGDPDLPHKECSGRDGIVDNDLDCDDSDPDVFPGADGWSMDCEEILDTGDTSVLDTGDTWEISLDTAIDGDDDDDSSGETAGTDLGATAVDCGCTAGAGVAGSWLVPLMLLFARRRRG